MMSTFSMHTLLWMIPVLEGIHRRLVSGYTETCPQNCLDYAEVRCNKQTGECGDGCLPGYYGLTCNKTCSCGGRSCLFLEGTCLEKNGKFKRIKNIYSGFVSGGVNRCPKNCYPHIRKRCHKHKTECTDGCVAGLYGISCNKTCSCDGGSCSFKEGTCLPNNNTPGNTKNGSEDHNNLIIGIALWVGTVFIFLLVIGSWSIIRFCKIHLQKVRERKEPVNDPNDDDSNSCLMDGNYSSGR